MTYIFFSNQSYFVRFYNYLSIITNIFAFLQTLIFRSLEYDPVPLTNSNYVFLIINSNVHHELSNGQYQLRRYQCEEASDSLNVPSLRSATLEGLNS